ncbi:bacillithiol system protein YtxJ [Ekhidna lutea]|uniref:Bacillithiol system protein YtxJ n=1 Tax=Ekhidna lutea TaxID=447679 RepID=A0A239HFH8_EKHLU|nr:monothiol bacilliredoxin BrxC family protein [Ekhidna lutea]SNS79034.1 bacillithiol system protein YtxJ [Ekhidna lutea]
MSYPLNWKSLDTIEEFDRLVETSRDKPALIFKHRPSSPESTHALQTLEADWSISPENLDLYMVDVMKDKDVAEAVTDMAGVINEYPQVLLFADGVTMYDESREMISVKKIKLALKIINRTFKWMETRV